MSLGLFKDGGMEYDLQETNHTVVTLIPKVKDPKHIREIRPISLCSVLYKIASKTLANRLRPFMEQIICEQQSAFVNNRLITDNTLLAFEDFRCMKHHRYENNGSFGLKLDMMKAYDRIEWPYLRGIMGRFGFSEAWIRRV